MGRCDWRRVCDGGGCLGWEGWDGVGGGLRGVKVEIVGIVGWSGGLGWGRSGRRSGEERSNGISDSYYYFHNLSDIPFITARSFSLSG